MRKNYIYSLAFLLSVFVFISTETKAQSEVLFSDDFEQYEDFTLSDFGEWTVYDEDKEDNTGIGGVSFPHNGERTAFLIFNSTLVPGLEDQATTLRRDFTAHSGEKVAASFAALLPPSDDWLISPKVSLGESGNIVSFWAKAASAIDNNERFRVLVSTTDVFVENFVPITPEPYVAMHDYVEPNNEARWVQFSFSLDDYSGQDVYIAINCVSSFYTGMGGPPINRAFVFLIDDFEVITGGCLTEVSNVKVTKTTTTSADIEWDGLPNDYLVEYGESGFTLGEGTQETLTSMEYTISDLEPQTEYEFYLRGKCSEGSLVMWTGPYKFMTDYPAVDLDYSYGFETENLVLDGWRVYSPEGRAKWTVRNIAHLAHEGERSIYYMNDYQEADAWLFSRGINIEENQKINISFWYFSSQYFNEKMEVTIGNSAWPNSQETVLWNNESIMITEYEEGTAEFTAPETGVYYIAFHCYSGNNTLSLYLDDIKIESAGFSGINKDNTVSGSSVKLYPNPSTDYLSVTLPENYNLNNAQYIISDVTGRVITKAPYVSTINVMNLEKGIYYLTITDNIRKESKSFIKK